MGNISTKKEEGRKITTSLNHRLIFAAAYFQKTGATFLQVIERKFQNFQERYGFADNRFEEFHHHCRLFSNE
jgi:hypothetical protein